MTRTTNARIAGATYLLYIALGLTSMYVGRGLAGSSSAERLALIAEHAGRARLDIVLSLAVCLVAVTLAVALWALTRDEDRELATLGLSFRIFEGMLSMVAAVASLALLRLATDHASGGAARDALAELVFALPGWNMLAAAFLFSIGSTLFTWLLLRGGMIPGPLAWLGLAASLLLVVGIPLQMLGLLGGPAAQLVWLPMLAFEVPLGFWLLLRGVTPARGRASA